MSIPLAKVTTRIDGASAQQRAVLLKILAGLGPTSVSAIELVPAARDLGASANAIELNMEISPDARANWHAQLIAKAFHQRSLERRLPPVVFFNAGHGGEALWNDPALRRGAPGLTLAQARDIAGRMRKAAVHNNAHLRRLELLRPRGFAFSAVLQAENPADFLLRGLEEVTKPLYSVRPQEYDGRWIEVLDGDGHWVMQLGAALAVRDEVAGCVPLLTGIDFQRPACPAAHPQRWRLWRRSF